MRSYSLISRCGPVQVGQSHRELKVDLDLAFELRAVGALRAATNHKHVVCGIQHSLKFRPVRRPRWRGGLVRSCCAMTSLEDVACGESTCIVVRLPLE
eukprot:scaffold91012_cov32-Tisochrysis_lutea.AAC.2